MRREVHGCNCYVGGSVSLVYATEWHEAVIERPGVVSKQGSQASDGCW